MHGQFQHQITGMYKPMSLALTPAGHLLVRDQTAAPSLFDAGVRCLGAVVCWCLWARLGALSDGTIYQRDDSRPPDDCALIAG